MIWAWAFTWMWAHNTTFSFWETKLDNLFSPTTHQWRYQRLQLLQNCSSGSCCFSIPPTISLRFASSLPPLLDRRTEAEARSKANRIRSRSRKRSCWWRGGRGRTERSTRRSSPSAMEMKLPPMSPSCSAKCSTPSPPSRSSPSSIARSVPPATPPRFVVLFSFA